VASLRLEDLYVRHPGAAVDVLAGIDLEVPDGTRLVLAGASGSGKTTVLRAIAGLAPVTFGRVVLDGHDVTRSLPGERDVALVQQEDTLQPHLDVRRNLGSALRWRRVPRDEEDRRVTAEARAFQLTRLLGRRPPALSVGERHEVALARSLVRRCSVLLLDEPLGRVDQGRRAALRRELLAVQTGYGVTTVLTTNDPVTAHALGELVAVLEDGRLLQVGTPAELSTEPSSTAVAELLSVPTLNLLPGTIERQDRGHVLRAGPLRVRTRLDLASGPVTVGVSPHDLAIGGDGPSGVVQRRVLLGPELELTVAGEDGTLVRVTADRDAPAVGATVRLRVQPGHLHLFDPHSGRARSHGV
jgi:multiple sugar transport system ATP-binding protein